MSRIGIAGIGVTGPGLVGWRDAAAVLTQAVHFDVRAGIPKAPPAGLPANERRRISPLIRLVLQCCEDTLSGCSGTYPSLRSVFSSSCGDLETVDKILRTLTLPDKPVSPTQFHNSVHNSPAGYWSIARGDRSGSISLSAYDSSFGAGLLNAAGLVLTGQGPTLLVAYDCVAPPALSAFRPYVASFAVGLLLVDAPARYNMGLELGEADSCDSMDDPALEALRLGNPAARSLPLLALLAANRSGTVTLPYLSDMGIVIDVDAHAPG